MRNHENLHHKDAANMVAHIATKAKGVPKIVRTSQVTPKRSLLVDSVDAAARTPSK